MDVVTLGAANAAAARTFTRPGSIRRIDRFNASYSTLDDVPPILDLHYASRMNLYGVETYTRAATETYGDMAGATQTASTNVAAFDRVAPSGYTPWVLPAGLKLGQSGQAVFNPSGMLPTDYTIIVDVNRPASFTNSGEILTISDGSVTNRVEIGCNASYQAYFIVQAAGAITANQALGPIQVWSGGPRRLVIAVKSGAVAYSDTGLFAGSSSNTVPAPNTRSQFKIGGGTFGGWIGRIRILPRAYSISETINAAAGDLPIAAWGDSLTFGTGGSASGAWPEVLRLARYPMSGVYNGGIGGETSTQIKVRALADTIRRDWTTVLWTGRNNFSDPATVLADTAAMVANLPHTRYMVMSVINKADGTENAGSSAYNQIVALNAALAARYGDRFLDIRSSLVTASGGSNDAPNVAWTADGLHLNNTGYAHVADRVSAFLRAKLWY